jgi:hypothetical protein
VPHNHPFTFITGGYLGSGYTTGLYRLSAPGGDLSALAEGMAVDITDRGSFQLERGRLLIYEKGWDVHYQLPPRELSISINYIERRDIYPQFLFDVERRRVGAAVGEVPAVFELLCDACEALGDPQTLALLGEIARLHPEQSIARIAAGAVSRGKQ